MDSKYKIINSNVGAVGDNSTAVNFNQLVNSKESSIDPFTLAKELELLRKELILHAKEPSHYIAISEVASAEKLATEGNTSSALQHIKKAGSWFWDVATKIGIGVATTAAKEAIGL